MALITPSINDPRWSEEKLAVAGDKGVNLRSSPSTNTNNILTVILNGDIVQSIEDPKFEDFYAIYLHNPIIPDGKKIGFAHKSVLSFRPRSAPNEPPVEPPATTWRQAFDATELRMIDYAIAYSGDFPEVGSHQKKLIQKFVGILEG